MSALEQIIDPGWAKALSPVADTLERVRQFLRAELAAGRTFLPMGDALLRAFTLPFDQVKVLIVGQDPYPNPSHPVGLAFSVNRDVRPLPGSLRNIYAELYDDLGITPAQHGDLSSWFSQGVLLLNRVLTVAPGKPGSHRGVGWEEVTACAIEALGRRSQPLVALLWGRDARQARSLLPASVPVIESAHPSPLSARHGFFGSRPFSRTNELLVQAGADPIDWTVR